MFCHNGTVFGFEHLREQMWEETDPAFQPLILGDTDSEHLFFWLLSRLDCAGVDRAGRVECDANEVARVVRESLLELDMRARALDLERPILNVLLTDGRIMVGHKAGMPLFLSTQKHRCADFDTCTAVKYCMEPERPSNGQVNHLLLASEQIASDENRWEELADGSTVSLCGEMMLRLTAPPEGWVAPILPERYRIKRD